MLSLVGLFATLWTVACQTLSRGFSRQKYWSGLPFSLGDLPHPRMEPASPASPALADGFFTWKGWKKAFSSKKTLKGSEETCSEEAALFFCSFVAVENQSWEQLVWHLHWIMSLLYLPHPYFKEHAATDPFSSDDLSKDSLRSPLRTPQLLIIVPSLDSTHIPLGIFWTPSLADLAALSPHLPLKLQCTWMVKLPLWCQAVTIFKGVQYLRVAYNYLMYCDYLFGKLSSN